MPMNPLRGKVLICAALLLIGCVGNHPKRLADSTETVLTAPLDHVKIALVYVLTSDGYPVGEEGADDDRVLITGYRRETEGIWDWLLKSRFGVSRSKVEVTLSPDSEDTTRLTISVIFEAKDHIWSAWLKTTPPPHRSASLHLQSVKKALGLL